MTDGWGLVMMDGGEPPAAGDWAVLLAAPASRVGALTRGDVPVEPGVYLWRRGGGVMYVGTARSLRRRLWDKHLGGGRSLAGSSLRRNVCELLLGIPARVTSNPDRELVTGEQAAAIGVWLSECELSWLICETSGDAGVLEKRLRAAYLPPLNRV